MLEFAHIVDVRFVWLTRTDPHQRSAGRSPGGSLSFVTYSATRSVTVARPDSATVMVAFGVDTVPPSATVEDEPTRFALTIEQLETLLGGCDAPAALRNRLQTDTHWRHVLDLCKYGRKDSVSNEALPLVSRLHAHWVRDTAISFAHGLKLTR